MIVVRISNFVLKVNRQADDGHTPRLALDLVSACASHNIETRDGKDLLVDYGGSAVPAQMGWYDLPLKEIQARTGSVKDPPPMLIVVDLFDYELDGDHQRKQVLAQAIGQAATADVLPGQEVRVFVRHFVAPTQASWSSSG